MINVSTNKLFEKNREREDRLWLNDGSLKVQNQPWVNGKLFLGGIIFLVQTFLMFKEILKIDESMRWQDEKIKHWLGDGSLETQTLIWHILHSVLVLLWGTVRGLCIDANDNDGYHKIAQLRNWDVCDHGQKMYN